MKMKIRKEESESEYINEIEGTFMDDERKQIPRRLTIRMCGPKVSGARLSAFDLVEIVRRTQSAIKQIGQLLISKKSNIRGRKNKEVQQHCEIFMVGWDKGSAIARFELAPSPQQINWVGDIGEASIDAFIEGMAKIATEKINRSSFQEHKKRY